MRLEFNFTNLFNQNTVINTWVPYVHANDGQIQFDHEADAFKGFDYKALMTTQGLRVDPRFGMAREFQDPRATRMGIHFYF